MVTQKFLLNLCLFSSSAHALFSVLEVYDWKVHIGAMVHGSLSMRDRCSELMDDTNLPVADLSHALNGLDRIHRVCGSSRLLHPEALRFAANKSAVTIVDIACGSAAVSTKLARRFSDMGKQVTRIAVDMNQASLDLVQESSQAEAFETRCLQEDLTTCNHLPVTGDIVICSYFCHHLSTEQTSRILELLFHCCSGLLLLLDLRRSLRGYYLAYAGTRLLSRSPIVHQDGPMSVKSAYTTLEFSDIVAGSSWNDFHIKNVSFQRFLMVGRK